MDDRFKAVAAADKSEVWDHSLLCHQLLLEVGIAPGCVHHMLNWSPDLGMKPVITEEEWPDRKNRSSGLMKAMD